METMRTGTIIIADDRDRTSEAAIRELLKHYLVDNIQPPIWTPQDKRPRDLIWEHIASLKIPSVLETPSLLLHNIRRCDSPDCLKRLFSSGNTLK
jgi:hypothetical protein